MRIDNKILAVLLLAAVGFSLTSNVMMLMSIERAPVSATGFGVEQQAGEANVTLSQEISIQLFQNSIDFNDLALGASNATLPLFATGPNPLALRNIGSIECNVSMAVLTGDDLWSTSTAPTSDFQYNVTANGSTTAQWYGGQNETDKLANVLPNAGWPGTTCANIIYNLSETAGENVINININITAPVGEPAGTKGATLRFQAGSG